MKTALTFLRTRAAVLLSLAALGLSQTGCAHPVWVEPSVQVRVGGPVYGPVYGPAPAAVYGQVYGSVYSTPPVVVATAPVWRPPAVVIPPRVVVPAPVYRPGWGHGRGYGGGYGGGRGDGYGGWHGHRHGDWR